MLTTTTYRFADDFGRSPGPDKRGGVFIPVLDVLADVLNQALRLFTDTKLPRRTDLRVRMPN
jgi:hypothetical protein